MPMTNDLHQYHHLHILLSLDHTPYVSPAIIHFLFLISIFVELIFICLQVQSPLSTCYHFTQTPWLFKCSKKSVSYVIVIVSISSTSPSITSLFPLYYVNIRHRVLKSILYDNYASVQLYADLKCTYN